MVSVLRRRMSNKAPVTKAYSIALRNTIEEVAVERVGVRTKRILLSVLAYFVRYQQLAQCTREAD